ncbi:MAG: hypothetical protein HAW59_00190 [Betaproteobacteria bacterium]|nr:hypothetical protein [Betaproteobacteria bacterium]
MYFSKAHKLVLSSSLSVFLASCGSPNYAPSEMHMSVEEVASEAPKEPEAIPALVKATSTVPALSNEKGADTFDVVVTNVPVRDLLFALARDSGVNMDVDSNVGGLVTMSALDQTLAAILERIALQIPIRVDRSGDAVIVKNDEPYHKRYHVDYTSVSRTYSSGADTGGVGGGTASISNSSSNSFWENLEESIAAILDVELEIPGEAAIAGEEAQANQLLTDSSEAEASFDTDNSYDFNPDTGILLVYAPDRLQREVQAYLDDASSIARRQVLLEATVVEVVLNNEYRQGIDWSAFNQFARDGLALYQGSAVGGPAAFINEIVREFTRTQTFTYVDGNGDGIIDASDDSLDFAGGLNGGGAGLREFRRISNPATYEAPGRTIGDFSFTPTIIPAIARVDATTGVPAVIAVPARVQYDLEYTANEINDTATRARAGGLVPSASSVPGAAFTAAYRSGDVSAAVELLDTFGDAKVLSSPRISVLNNQPALLRVVDQEVYFSLEITEEIDEETGSVTERTFDVTENTVDVGFSMNVLPHITGGDEIYLNLKPSVTRVLDYRRAPVPSIAGSGQQVDNLVPITRIRELESVMVLRDGEIAVMGGLLEDRVGDSNTSVPGVSNLPGIGSLFQKKQESTTKTEFVVFIKARIITNPSIHADYSDYQSLLPGSDFIIRDRTDTAIPPKQKKAR